MRISIALPLIALTLVACSSVPKEDRPLGKVSPEVAETQKLDTATPEGMAQIRTRGSNVLAAFKAYDMKALAALVHAVKGVRFSPHGYINIDTDRVLKASQLESAIMDPMVHVWGTHDGSGEDIALDTASYMLAYVTDQDYAEAPQSEVNRIIGTGNTMVNIDEVYPDADFIEYHFSGFDPQYGGMDWQSLRLFFEWHDGGWKLVGVSHDGWTI